MIMYVRMNHGRSLTSIYLFKAERPKKVLSARRKNRSYESQIRGFNQDMHQVNSDAQRKKISPRRINANTDCVKDRTDTSRQD